MVGPLATVAVGLQPPDGNDDKATFLAVAKRLVLHSVSSAHTRRSYAYALSQFLEWYRSSSDASINKATVQRYCSWLESRALAPSSINIHLSAVRKLAQAAADNALLAPELASNIARISGVRRQAPAKGNWLTAGQATALLNTPTAKTLKGVRDRAILSLLIGCGLRRSELAALNVEHLQTRAGRWVIPDLASTGHRVRTVPVPAWTKSLVSEWIRSAGRISGPLFPPMNKAGVILDGRLTEDTIWSLVRDYGAQIGLPSLAPNDLRRTCARLCRASGGELHQIQLLLGHASVQTTERYLGTQETLLQAVNDNLPVAPDLPPARKQPASERMKVVPVEKGADA